MAEIHILATNLFELNKINSTHKIGYVLEEEYLINFLNNNNNFSDSVAFSDNLQKVKKNIHGKLKKKN